MDFEAQRELQPELGRSERLLWAGRPATGLLFRPSDWFMIPFSLVWGGFAIFWETVVIGRGAPFFFALCGIPFVLAGLYLIFGRFIYDAWARSRTRYGVSNQRVLIRKGGLSKSVVSINLSSVNEMTIRVKPGGTGTLELGPSGQRFTFYTGREPQRRQSPPVHAFEAIRDVRGVMEIIREAQRKLVEERQPG